MAYLFDIPRTRHGRQIIYNCSYIVGTIKFSLGLAGGVAALLGSSVNNKNMGAMWSLGRA
jgi:hypothetical protein